MTGTNGTRWDKLGHLSLLTWRRRCTWDWDTPPYLEGVSLSRVPQWGFCV